MKQRWFLGSVVLLLVPLLLAGCGVAQEEHDTVIAERDATLAELASRQSDYDDVSAELAEIMKVHPPGDFASVTELETWVRKNVQPTYDYIDEDFRSALKVQSQGIEDGYLISIGYDEDDTDPDYGWIYCGGLVNGVLYTWFPDESEVYSHADIGFVR